MTGRTKTSPPTSSQLPAPPAAFASIRSVVTVPAPPVEPVAIERRKSRQLAKGQRGIDAVLDLHGMRQHEAHAALRYFLMRAQGDGAKFVKVITGKGARIGDDEPRPFLAPPGRQRDRGAGGGGGERGVLRRLVPQWLQEPDLCRLVVGLSSAGRSHGGDGALYIELRRVKPPR